MTCEEATAIKRFTQTVPKREIQFKKEVENIKQFVT